MKQGKGFQICLNGDIIIGNWYLDRLNGVAKIFKFNNEGFEITIFKSGI